MKQSGHFGPNCGIDDLDAIARMDRACDDFGVDTIETGNAVAVAMEGGVKEFGDTAGAEELVNEIGKGTPLGRILGAGAGAVGKAFGVSRVPVVKNQAMPAYDPRAVKGVGVTYATSPMGADHTAGYAVATNIMKVGGDVNPLLFGKSGQAFKQLPGDHGIHRYGRTLPFRCFSGAGHSRCP